MYATFAEYVWLDAGRGGDDPMPRFRSKTKVLHYQADPGPLRVSDLPVWNFDGSSTGQSDGDSADLPLKPVSIFDDPFRSSGLLVLCEVMDKDGETPHETNRRARLVELLKDEAIKKKDPWLGFEQEYMILTKNRFPIGFVNGQAPAQGPYYCGVGAREAHGREIMQEHMEACLNAGVLIVGTNAEVCPGQWEYQIGPADNGIPFTGQGSTALTLCDHLQISRYILHRVAEKHGYDISLDVKPVPGDWNGSGCHTNFSTKEMRDGAVGASFAAIEDAIRLLEPLHQQFVDSGAYGYGLERRLTGRHETCAINEFRTGDSNRTASVRIPNHVVQKQRGYFEDRRPGANCDPYRVAHALIAAVCGRYTSMPA